MHIPIECSKFIYIPYTYIILVIKYLFSYYKKAMHDHAHKFIMAHTHTLVNFLDESWCGSEVLLQVPVRHVVYVYVCMNVLPVRRDGAHVCTYAQGSDNSCGKNLYIYIYYTCRTGHEIQSIVLCSSIRGYFVVKMISCTFMLLPVCINLDALNYSYIYKQLLHNITSLNEIVSAIYIFWVYGLGIRISCMIMWQGRSSILIQIEVIEMEYNRI